MVGKLKKSPATNVLPFQVYEFVIEGTQVQVNCEDPKVKSLLRNTTSYRVKGYKFSSAYQDGTWDGKVKLGRWYRSKFTFPIGLLPYVVQALEASGYSVRLDDRRPITGPALEPLKQLDGVALWEHQEDVLRVGQRTAPPNELIRINEETAKFLHNSENSKACPLRIPGMGIVWIATGGGKTEAVAALLGCLARPTLFVVYGGDLVRQTHKRFEDRIGSWLKEANLRIGIVNEGDFDPGFITVASISTLSVRIQGLSAALEEARDDLRKRIAKAKSKVLAQKALKSFQNEWMVSSQLELHDELLEADPKLAEIYKGHISAVDRARKRKAEVERFLKKFEVLVYDEAHGAGGVGGYAVSMACPARFRYALSATPLDRSDADNWKVVAAFGDPIIRVRTKLLVERGILPKATIRIVKVSGVFNNRWPSAYKVCIVNHEPRLNSAGLIAQKHIEKGEKVLILFKQIKHGENLFDVCERYNLKACLLDGDSSQDERDEGVRDLNNGVIDVLLASDIFKQGVDSPGFDVLINQAAGKATIDTMQRFGRGLRGDRLTVYDYADGHNKYTARHSAERLEIYINYECFPIEWAKEFNC